jgi:hypothetical protein
MKRTKSVGRIIYNIYHAPAVILVAVQLFRIIALLGFCPKQLQKEIQVIIKPLDTGLGTKLRQSKLQQ